MSEFNKVDLLSNSVFLPPTCQTHKRNFDHKSHWNINNSLAVHARLLHPRSKTFSPLHPPQPLPAFSDFFWLIATRHQSNSHSKNSTSAPRYAGRYSRFGHWRCRSSCRRCPSNRSWYSRPPSACCRCLNTGGRWPPRLGCRNSNARRSQNYTRYQYSRSNSRPVNIYWLDAIPASQVRVPRVGAGPCPSLLWPWAKRLPLP